MEDKLAEYKQNLEDLTLNSKPLISMLTVLAEENVEHAPQVSQLIIKRLREAPLKSKLPALYLVDSILKNFGGQYKKLFGAHLSEIFLCVFLKAEARMRQDLFRLRSTWDHVLSKSLLQQLDVDVNQVDHNWPIKQWGQRSRSKSSRSHHRHGSPNTTKRRSSKSEEFIDNIDENLDDDVCIEEEVYNLDDEQYQHLMELTETLRQKKSELSELNKIEEQTIHTDYENLSTSNNEEQENGRIRSEDSGSCEKDVKPYDPNLCQSKVSPPESGNSDADAHYEQKIIKEESEEKIKLETHPTADAKAHNAVASETTKTVAISVDAFSQTYREMKDQSVQWRSRRKTKNFTNQFRAPSRSIGVSMTPQVRSVHTQAGDELIKDAMRDQEERDDFDLWESGMEKRGSRECYARHSLRMMHTFRSIFDQKLLCDIVLITEDNVRIPTHKMVLMGNSDFIYKLFKKKDGENVKELHLDGIRSTHLKPILEYFYSSQLDLCVDEYSEGHVTEVINAIQGLQVSRLFSACSQLECALSEGECVRGWMIRDERLVRTGGQDLREDDAKFDQLRACITAEETEREKRKTILNLPRPLLPSKTAAAPSTTTTAANGCDSSDSSSESSESSDSSQDPLPPPPKSSRRKRGKKPRFESEEEEEEDEIRATITKVQDEKVAKDRKTKTTAPHHAFSKTERKVPDKKSVSVNHSHPAAKRSRAPDGSSKRPLASSASDSDAPHKKMKKEEHHNFSCYNCGKKFASKKRLNFHILTCSHNAKKKSKEKLLSSQAATIKKPHLNTSLSSSESALKRKLAGKEDSSSLDKSVKKFHTPSSSSKKLQVSSESKLSAAKLAKNPIKPASTIRDSTPKAVKEWTAKSNLMKAKESTPKSISMKATTSKDSLHKFTPTKDLSSKSVQAKTNDIVQSKPMSSKSSTIKAATKPAVGEKFALKRDSVGKTPKSTTDKEAKSSSSKTPKKSSTACLKSAPSKDTTKPAAVVETKSNWRFTCQECGQGFDIECFFKAHTAKHRRGQL